MSILIVRVMPEGWNTIKDKVWLLEKKIFGKDAFEDIEELDTFKNSKAYNLVAYDAGKIIGYLMSQPLNEAGDNHSSIQGRNKIFYLESVGVLKQYRGKGIGKKLITAYCEFAKTKKYKKLLLDSKEDSMIQLCEYLGFKKLRYNKAHFGIQGAWIMEKDLGGK